MKEKNTRINLEISRDLLNEIKILADTNELTYSAMIRLILKEYVTAVKMEDE